MSECGKSFLYGCGTVAVLVAGVQCLQFWPQTLVILAAAGLATALGFGVRCFLRLAGCGWID